MSQLLTRTARLVPVAKRAKPFPSFATAYDYEPEPSDGRVFGNLFVVIEVLTARRQAEELADLIIKTIGEAYYNSSPQDEPEPTAETDPDTRAETSEDTTESKGQPVNVKVKSDQAPNQPSFDAYQQFEFAVKTLNQQLADYTDQGNAGWVGRISAVIAVQIDDQLHITQTGSASGYLYRGSLASHITEDMGGAQPQRPISTFSNIASGSLQAEDRILLSTPALFHHVNTTELPEIVTNHSPESAVQRLSEIINQNPNADRVAALVIEVATAEALASRPGATSELPDVATVGKADTMLEAAKGVAVPAATRAAEVGRKLASGGKQNILPKVKDLGKLAAKHGSHYGGKAFQWTKATAQHPTRRLYLAGAVGLVVIISAAGLYRNLQTDASTVLVKRYQTDYAAVADAELKIKAGDKTGARQELQTAQADLEKLAALPQRSLLEKRLAASPHDEAQPTTVAALQSQASSLLDQLDGIATVAASPATSFDSLKNAKPGHFAIAGGKAVFVDNGNDSIYVYDTSTGNLRSTVASPSGVGKVLEVVPVADGTGVYLLTDEPGVWLYRLDNDSLARQTVSFGDWVASKQIAAYAGNVYLMQNDGKQVWRHARTVGGFSGKTAYFTADSGTGGATAMTVDGNVYLAGSFGFKRFTSGKADSSISLPSELNNPTELESIQNGDVIVVVDPDKGRLGLVHSTPGGIGLDSQIKLSGSTKFSEVHFDSKTGKFYALSDGKLIKFDVPK